MLSGVIIVSVLLLSFWMTWEVFENQTEKTQGKLKTEISRVDHVMGKSIEQAEYVVETISKQILSIGVENQLAIAQLLNSYDIRPDIYGLFSWVDAQDVLSISSNMGILSQTERADISDRDYIHNTHATPWRSVIGKPVEGRVSHKWVLPIAMGITDNSGRYLGTVIISLDIHAISQSINQTLSMTHVSYALLSPAYDLLGYGGSQSTDKMLGRVIAEKSKEAANTMNIDTIDHFQEMQLKDLHGEFTFIAPSRAYPYYIIISYNRTETFNELLVLLFPRLLQLMVTAFFLIGILWVVRHRMILPVMRLTRATARLARGRADISIPENGPMEIQQLAKQLSRVRDYLKERKMVDEEMRRKVMDMKQRKDAAELADRSKSEFLACMSHELRTPLNAIIGFTDIMMGGFYGKIDNEKYEEYIQDIHTSGTHLLDIINDLLDLARVEAGVVQLQEKELDITHEIKKAVRLLSERAQQSDISITTSYDDALPHLLADPLRLRQILINLLSNAIKFTSKGGTIHVSASMHSGDKKPFIISIEDSGTGMKPEEIPIALSKFGQINSHLRDKKHPDTIGVGLGLPLSIELMELHGGTLDIESESGKGTCVILRFPYSRIPSSE